MHNKPHDAGNQGKWYKRYEKSSQNQKKRSEKPVLNNSTKKKTFPQKPFSPSGTTTATRCTIIQKQPMFSEKSLSPESQDILNNFDTIVQSVRPLNSRQLLQLPGDIKILSHELTDERGSRRVGYMNEAKQLSAYVRYFTWWNLIRLTRIFANMPADSFIFSDDDVCLDIGSGPLTVVIALWLARPELREKKLTWYCLDISQASLALGEDLYLSVAARTPAKNSTEAHWNIVRVKGKMGTEIKRKASFVSCANMFNELFQNSDRPPDFLAKQWAESLLHYTDDHAAIFACDPGIPTSSRLLSLLRDALLRRNMHVHTPCPHEVLCPMDGKRGGKWCNFAFSTQDAPRKLLELSRKSTLPKERAVISFIFATSGKDVHENTAAEILKLRIASDPIRLPGYKTGYYACSEMGLTLVINESGTDISSGDSISIRRPENIQSLPRDRKTAAREIFL